ncbi:MAG: BREX system serine/threonine kinase PglW, partial [bacterium]
ALEALQALPPPPGAAPLPATRLRQLAAATARKASLSSRLELYPRRMSAARAIKLSLGALAGARVLAAEQIRDRVLSRYPEAEPLPDRPELDRLLEEAGSELRWQPQAGTDVRDGDASGGAYVAPLREFTTVHTGTSYATATRSRTLTPHFEEVPADQAERKQFDQRLRYSLDQQHFLALIVSPHQALEAEQTLARRFPVDVRSFDELLIRHMKAFAIERKVDWELVLRADGVPLAERAGHRDWNNLQRVVREALPRVQAELAESPRPVLLTNPGLLARYDQLPFLDALRDETGRTAGPPGLWLLVATDAQGERPTLDGKPVPVFTSAQWARIPQSWLEKRSHSSGPEEVPDR